MINKSLSIIKYANSGEVNIDVNIMSNLAFNMLKQKGNTFSKSDLLHISNAFSLKKKVDVDSEALLTKMIKARLVCEVGPNTYKFRYPYTFYYFSGRYIAYNFKDPEIKSQVEYMCQRLYNEKYGNIIIFVCHFANNIEIIDSILLAAYLSLEKYKTFDFNQHTDIFEKAKVIMDGLLTKTIVGTESDVKNNCQDELKIKDDLGIQDGSVCEPIDASDELEDQEKDLASISAALRTLDVLGQIIMNYPGDIDGDIKISIIDEIHKLGMRITEAMLSTIGLLEKDFIEYVVNYVKDKKQSENVQEIIQASQTLFSCIVAGMTCRMIRKISAALCNDSLLNAVVETFSMSSSISQNLILVDLQFNLLKKPDIREALQIADEFDKNKSAPFARAVLRSIIADYLRHNKCGYNIRSQLCSRFKLSDKMTFIEEVKNRNL